jgi:hypothetical protein
MVQLGGQLGQQIVDALEDFCHFRSAVFRRSNDQRTRI